ncbi:hypothetical protein PCANC_15613 [Puccinia coronata f. sp. avenae]|uniref:RRM domain-containing protein n=1 Tax=Puccinia coronata f. sp. avenae TaxID=200324 RepID=A0A2N5SJT0_9BASI|nr:hypothetical protein PCANC_15613 [Puccinia coronata f. sp. avenae]
MAPKNKKGQKVLLTDFLADTSTGRSWADEMDELPTAPAPRDPNEPSNAGLGGSHLTRGDGNRYGDRDRRGGDREYMDRPSRVEIPIPDKPPFNAFVGNLSWEVGSTELEEFFGASHIISIRLITDSATGKPKGYGYVEFDEREALVAATDKSGRELGGRPVRVSVAEPPKEREDRTGGAWRREGPLPTFEDNRRTRHSSHQERSSLDDVDRGERMGFGSKFVPSTNTATNLTRRTQSGRGFSRGDGGFGFESEGGDRGERMGFGSKFVASVDEPRKDREPPLRGGHFVPSRATPVGSDDGHSASGGSTRRAPQMERKNTDIEPTAADTVSNWRRAKPAAPSEPEPSPAVPPSAPPTRRKLELSARTVTSSDGTSTPPTSVVTNKPSPFGAAKPIDSTEREKAIQEKLDRERAELSAANSPKPAANLDEKSTSEGEPKASPSVTTSAAPKAPKPNPFGSAKPVDTLQKELEVEQKLEREKALLEEKLKKEAQEAKAAPPVSIKQPAKGPSNASEPPNPTTTSSANQPAHPPTAPATQPRSRWTTQPPPISKPATNGNAAPPAITTTAAPAPASKATASPLSPSLSSFRKEGISFAALAKTAAANSSSSPAITAGPKGSAKEEQLHKSVAQHPRTILKRVEGLEIKNE